MSPVELTFTLAFVGGVVSFISPCMLPLLPVYLGYLSGQVSHATQTTPASARRRTVWHSLIFVLGFTLVFVSVGLLTTVFIDQVSGGDVDNVTAWIGRIGGGFAIVYGLHFIGVMPALIDRVRADGRASRLVALTDRLFYGSARWQPKMGGTGGFVPSFILGMALAAGWTPCIGPVYGAVLTLGINGGALDQVVGLMLVYSLGLGLPFVLTAALIGGASALVARLKRSMRTIEVVSGIFLLILGLGLVSGQLQSISRRFANQFADISIAVEQRALEWVSPDLKQVP